MMTDGPAPAVTADPLEEAARLAQVDPEAANALLETVLAGCEQDATSQVRPAALYLQARLVLMSGRPDHALSLIADARQTYLALGMRDRALRTDLGRMHVLDDLGRHAEAHAVGTDLLSAVTSDAALAGDVELRASVLGNLGVALGFMGDHAGALAAYASATVAWRQAAQPEQVAATTANQGIELLAMGRPAAAIDRLTEAIEAFGRIGDDLSGAKALGHRGEALSGMGRFLPALDDFASARAVLVDSEAATEAWRLEVESASTLLRLGLHEEGLHLLEAVEPRLEKAGLAHDLAQCLLLQGVALLGSGVGPAAAVKLASAVEQFGRVLDPVGEAAALVQLSRVVALDSARDHLGRAELLLRDHAAPDVSVELERRLADLSSDDDAGLIHLTAAQRLADGLGQPGPRQAVLQDRAALLYRIGDSEGCIAAAETAAGIANNLVEELSGVTQRAGYLASTHEGGDWALRALLDRGGPGDDWRAAALADRHRADTLVDMMRGGMLRWPTGDPQTSARREELDDAYSALFTAGRQERRLLWQRIRQLEARISTEHALVSQGSGREGLRVLVPFQATPVRNLAYYVLAEEVMAFVTVGPDCSVVRRLATTGQVHEALEALAAHLGSSRDSAETRGRASRAAACTEVLQRLHRLLIAPVSHLLDAEAGSDDWDGGPGGQSGSTDGGPEAPEPLVIVPHGLLHRVPFQALHDGRKYLVESWTLTMAPSQTVAHEASLRVARTVGRSLVVGCSDERAPFIDDEVADVASSLAAPTVVLQGPRATRAAVLDHLDGARTVHFACHGLFRPENAAFSSLRLADVWLRAADVGGSDLAGATVVLSACETGGSGAREGFAALGLAQGFLAAGARHVMVSQWLVDDMATATMMGSLHRELAAGVEPAAALRRAQLLLMQDRPHPYYWAPFVAVGAPASRGATR